MVRTLQDGCNVALTADVPKVSRVAGAGIVKLAQVSGRPVYPVAVATSGRITLASWDRSVVNLPFSRGAIVAGEPIRVATSDTDAIETARIKLEQGLNAATERAYALVDRRSPHRG